MTHLFIHVESDGRRNMEKISSHRKNIITQFYDHSKRAEAWKAITEYEPKLDVLTIHFDIADHAYLKVCDERTGEVLFIKEAN